MTTSILTTRSSLATLKGKSRLWWFGLLIMEMGFLFYVFAFNQSATLEFLDVLSSSSLVGIQVGEAETIQLLAALSSCVMAAWGITLMAASLNYTNQVKNYTLAAMIVWFILDSIASISFGFAINALLNLGFLIPGLILAKTNKVLTSQ